MHLKLDQNTQKYGQQSYNAIKKSRMIRSQQKYSKINNYKNSSNYQQRSKHIQDNPYKRNYSQPKIKANYFQMLLQKVPHDQIIIEQYIQRLKQIKLKVKSDRKKSQRLESNCQQLNLDQQKQEKNRKLTQPSSKYIYKKSKYNKSTSQSKYSKSIDKIQFIQQQKNNYQQNVKSIINESKKKLKKESSDVMTFQNIRNKVKQQKIKSLEKQQQLKDKSIDQIYQFKQQNEEMKQGDAKVFIRDKRKHSSKLKIIQSNFRYDQNVHDNQKTNLNNNNKIQTGFFDKQKSDRYINKEKTELNKHKTQKKQCRQNQDQGNYQIKGNKNKIIVQKIINIKQSINLFQRAPYFYQRKQKNKNQFKQSKKQKPNIIMRSVQLKRSNSNQQQHKYQSKLNHQKKQSTQNNQFSLKPYQIFKSTQLKRIEKQPNNKINVNSSEVQHKQKNNQIKRYSKSSGKFSPAYNQNKIYQQNTIYQQNKKLQRQRLPQPQNIQLVDEMAQQEKTLAEKKNYLKSIENYSTIQIKKQTLQFLGQSCINIKHDLIKSEQKMNTILNLLGLKTDQLNQVLENPKKKRKREYQRFTKIFPQGFFQ